MQKLVEMGFAEAAVGSALEAVNGARLKVMLMKGIIITFISNSNHKIQVNLLG